MGQRGVSPVVPYNPNSRLGRVSPYAQERAMEPTSVYVGIDVSKDRLDVHVLPSEKSFGLARDDESLAAFAARLERMRPALVVLEASGGYEYLVAAALAAAKLPVAVVNPRQVRDFARATGQFAKTDRLDAIVIARFAQAVRPEPRGVATEAADKLAELVQRRRQVIAMITAERNRRNQTRSRAVRASIDRLLQVLQAELAEIDTNIGSGITESAVWCVNEDLLKSVPGIGPASARCLIADLPELGRLDRRKIAALVGIAPMAQESGAWRGKRSIRGGRAHVRAALYMAALVATRHNPVIRDLYRRLLAAGKAKKLALVACMRKLLTILNAVVRDQSPWHHA